MQERNPINKYNTYIASLTLFSPTVFVPICNFFLKNQVNNAFFFFYSGHSQVQMLSK